LICKIRISIVTFLILWVQLIPPWTSLWTKPVVIIQRIFMGLKADIP